MYRGSVSTFADLSVTFRRSTSPCPEGSFLAPEISRLFGDTVGASLVATAQCSCYMLRQALQDPREESMRVLLVWLLRC